MNKKDLEKIPISEVKAYQFSDTAIEEKPVLNAKNVWEFLEGKYQLGCIFGLDNLKQYGVYNIHGWQFNFRPYLKKFYIKQYDFVTTEYAPNKTLIRKSTYGVIQNITEVNHKLTGININITKSDMESLKRNKTLHWKQHNITLNLI